MNYTNNKAMGKERRSETSNDYADTLQSLAIIQIYLK